MTTAANIGKWVSQSQRRLYPLFLLLMVLPIVLFAYSVGEVLRHLRLLHQKGQHPLVAPLLARLEGRCPRNRYEEGPAGGRCYGLAK